MKLNYWHFSVLAVVLISLLGWTAIKNSNSNVNPIVSNQQITRTIPIPVKDEFTQEKRTDGTILCEGQMLSGKKNGFWIFYHKNGKVSGEYRYNNGLKDGLCTEYYSDGAISFKGSYKNDLMDGLWQSWDESHKERMDSYYIAGKLDGNVIKYHNEIPVDLVQYEKGTPIFWWKPFKLLK